MASFLQRRGRELGIGVVMLWLVGINYLPARAQPDAIPGADITTAQAFDKLRQQLSDMEVIDPQRAILEYQHFYDRVGYKYPEVSIGIASLVAQLYLHELHSKDKAVETYDWAIQKYGKFNGGERLQRELSQILAADQPTTDHLVVKPDLIAPGHLAPLTVPVAPAPQATDDIEPIYIAPIGVLTPATIQSQTAPKFTANENPPKKLSVAPVVVQPPLARAATTVAPISAQGIKVTVAIAQLRQGKLSPEVIWQQSALLPDDLIYGLQTPGLTTEPDDERVCITLGYLLLMHGAKRLEAPEPLPLRTRLYVEKAKLQAPKP